MPFWKKGAFRAFFVWKAENNQRSLNDETFQDFCAAAGAVPDFLRRLQASGYKGVFMHEVRAGVNATPENVVKAYKEVILGKMKK